MSINEMLLIYFHQSAWKRRIGCARARWERLHSIKVGNSLLSFTLYSKFNFCAVTFLTVKNHVYNVNMYIVSYTQKFCDHSSLKILTWFLGRQWKCTRVTCARLAAGGHLDANINISLTAFTVCVCIFKFFYTLKMIQRIPILSSVRLCIFT